MLPTTSHVQAQLHAEELHRRAAAHRAVASARRPAAGRTTTPALQAWVGAQLVRVGARLQGRSPAGPPTLATSVSGRSGS